MASYRWPSTDRHRPENAIEHATYLKAEFDSVSNTANASLANTSLLPSELESRVSIGISKGIAEAQSNHFCPKWSEIDKSIFSKVMLKNITAEAALEARDRVPLPQFNGLHESYNALHTKLVTHVLPTATTHQFTGAGTATEATSVIDLVSAVKKASEETDKVSTSLSMPTNRQKEKAENIDDEESEEDTNEEEEEEEIEMDEGDDGESDQEVMEEGDDVSGDNSSEEGSSEDASDSEERSETDSDAGSEEVGEQEIVREANVPNVNGDGQNISTTVNLKIEQQASVNRLEEMTATELLDCLSWSLTTLLWEQKLSPEAVHFSSISLLDNGDLRVVMHAESREALQQITNSTDWCQKVEKGIVCWQVPTYRVRMHNVEINSLRFQNRREKAAIIRRLAEANRAISEGNEKPIIRDIRWSPYSLPKVRSSLIVEFLDPKQATQALDLGLCWQEKRYRCFRQDSGEIKRCSRCQGYEHLSPGCSAPYRCGKCAKQHATGTCKSNVVKCASCGGDHRAGNKKCPAKAEARRRQTFLKETASQAIESAAEAHGTAPTPVRNSISAARTQTETSMPSPVSLDANSIEDEVKSEPDRSLPQVAPTQDAYPDTATLLKKINDLRKETEDIRKIVVARDGALQTTLSGGTKRRAEEAFKSEAEAESSAMATKRIKQEQPTRDGSMGLWRQPSPFILNRPE